ncbi:MAG: isoaspartyl peptidase/L-asparaginase [Bacteroidota bacterium]
MTPKLIIHGGFYGELLPTSEIKTAKQRSLQLILEKAYAYLLEHSALETVTFTVGLLENDPLFNAGTGSQIQNDGQIRASAGIMDGTSKKFGGVINLQGIKNPILVAHRLLDFEDRVLSGQGAFTFAHEHQFEEASLETQVRRKEYEEKLAASRTSTVGCVALDSEGRLAAATSTGGKGFEIPGRVSDSATIAGNYANNDCGISCTGVGEDIVSAGVAVKAVTRVSDGMDLDQALDRTFAELAEFDGFAGAIAIDAKGNIRYRESHPQVVYGWHDGEKTKTFE